MLTKATAKFIKSLQLKKYRKQEQLFVVEGAKSVLEVMKSLYKVKMLVGSEDFLQANDFDDSIEVVVASQKELDALGSFKSSDQALAVVEQRDQTPDSIDGDLTLVLDDINDPGNLGTIIRIADWYGIKSIVASPETVELYNPKVIAACKGSFCRVNIHYTALGAFLNGKKGIIKYGAFMKGENLHKTELISPAILILGNEANGISQEVEELIDAKISIPGYGSAESLNVAMATAILCDNFMRMNN